VSHVKVLVVDDEPVSALVAATIVRRLGHEVTTASDGDDAWQHLQAGAFDVVISDRDMPVVGGLELCRRLREQGPVGLDGAARTVGAGTGGAGTGGAGQVRYTYLILVTAHDSRSDALVGMQAGADDYLSKPVSPAQLELRLIAAQRVSDLHRSLERQQQDLVDIGNSQHALARHDPLTGLPNRRALQEELDRFRARASRHGRGFSVAMLDIDHFKAFNDTAGHLEGDRVLMLVADALSSRVRSTDGLYRFGGEEFALLLDTADRAGAQKGADRLRQAVLDLRLAHPGRPGEVVTVSSGVAQHDPSRLEPDAVLADADAALYRAKQAGRNMTCGYGDDDRARTEAPADG